MSYLVSHYSEDAKLQTVVDSLPKFANELYGDARESARGLLRSRTPNPLARIARGIVAAVSGGSTKETALANCIFDLQLTAFFSEFTKYFGDNDVASVVVDALLYQATGFEAGTPTEHQILFTGTHHTRGIHKYQVAHKATPHIGDIEAWTFGKEFSAIVSGSPLDIACVVSVSPFSLIMRGQARWHVRYLLYGTPPTKEEEQALEAAIKKQEKSLQAMIDGFRRTKDA